MSNLSSERMLKLMAYADGELEGDERLEVERLLITDLDAARFVDEIAGLGELVVEGHEGSKTARAAQSFDIADSVIAAIRTSEATSNVSSLEAARTRRGKGWAVGAAVAGALALAASMTMMAKQRNDALAPMAPVAAIPTAAGSAEPGVDVDLVESAGETVRVFYLSSESSPTTSVVVWVDESRGTGR